MEISYPRQPFKMSRMRSVRINCQIKISFPFFLYMYNLNRLFHLLETQIAPDRDDGSNPMGLFGGAMATPWVAM